MNRELRERLIGYLLGSLTPDEHAAVRAKLDSRPELRAELDALAATLRPLSDEASLTPPVGLAEKTCAFVFGKHPDEPIAPSQTAPVGRSSWSLLDLAVTGGICLAMASLLYPAIAHSRNSAQITACQENLRELHAALSTYGLRNGKWPGLLGNPRLSFAGIYGPLLRESGDLESPSPLFCPAVERRTSPPSIPRIDQIVGAKPSELPRMHRIMGGDYAYSLGYMDQGSWSPVRGLGRDRFVVMADAQAAAACGGSTPHGGSRNVLCEGGQVRLVSGSSLCEGGDCFFTSDGGLVEAGLHPEDSVVAPSDRPLLLPLR